MATDKFNPVLSVSEKELRTKATLDQVSLALKKITVETALNAEMTEHLGYKKNRTRLGENARNGHSCKTLLSGKSQFSINIPRDRAGSFEPLLVKKHQTHIKKMDEHILFMYAKGMSSEEILFALKGMYGTDVSSRLVSKVSSAVQERITAWQNRPLDSSYAMVYLDYLVVKVPMKGVMVTKSVFLALGVNSQGKKELLGLWLAKNERIRFWRNVLAELKNRGLQNIRVVCIDEFNGFTDAIMQTFPGSKIQLCLPR